MGETASDYDEVVRWLSRQSIPFVTGEYDGRLQLRLHVPDEAAGRATPDHPGVYIALVFVADRFVGMVKL
jgi:hypothetical protein